jgi:hypothetical protein
MPRPTPGERLGFLGTCLTFGVALIGAMLAPVVTEAISSDPPPADCLKVISDYRDFAQKSPQNYELVMPGDDGQGYVLRDPNAQSCDVQPVDLFPPQTLDHRLRYLGFVDVPLDAPGVDFDELIRSSQPTSTAGTGVPDVELTDSLTLGLNGGQVSDLGYQPGLAADFDTCKASLDYKGELVGDGVAFKTADLQRDRSFCVKTDQDRYVVVSVESITERQVSLFVISYDPPVK